MDIKKLKDVYSVVKELGSGSPMQGEVAVILSDELVINMFTQTIFNSLNLVVQKLEDITDVIIFNSISISFERILTLTLFILV